jgi:hypothetical protein
MNEIISENKLFRFASELQHTADDYRKVVIKNILQKLQDVNLVKDNNIQKFDKELEGTEKLMYKRQWSRLQDFQKEDRILDYIKRTYPDKKHEIIQKNIMKLIEDGVLISKNIKYVSEKGELESIEQIKINDDCSVNLIKTEKAKKK